MAYLVLNGLDHRCGRNALFLGHLLVVLILILTLEILLHPELLGPKRVLFSHYWMIMVRVGAKQVFVVDGLRVLGGKRVQFEVSLAFIAFHHER